MKATMKTALRLCTRSWYMAAACRLVGLDFCCHAQAPRGVVVCEYIHYIVDEGCNKHRPAMPPWSYCGLVGAAGEAGAATGEPINS